MEIYSPQEDSFLMQEALLKEVPLDNDYKHKKFLEIGIGSGILLETIKLLKVPNKNIFGLDINPFAVNLCQKKGFNCINSNLFEKIFLFHEKKFDYILFNPPYLPEDKTEPKESRIATTGGKKGSLIINKFLKTSKDYLAINGKVFLLTSSLTKDIKWNKYKKNLLISKKFFFEELSVWVLSL